MTSAERGKTVTVLGCFNAGGTYAPLPVIFRGKRLKPKWAVGSPAGTVIRMTDSGWLSAETFVDWGREFVKFLPKDGLPDFCCRYMQVVLEKRTLIVIVIE